MFGTRVFNEQLEFIFNSKEKRDVDTRITLREIAAELGLSVQAVSMALRNHREIAPATRERIKAKAAELGYQPDPGLRALADYRTRRRGAAARWSEVALVHNAGSEAAWAGSLFHRNWLRHLIRATKARGIKITIHGLGSHCERAHSVFDRLHDRGITGVFVAPPELTPEAPKVVIPRDRFQVVTFGPEHLYRDHHTVQADYYENLRLAWGVLAARGRRRIGLIYQKRQGWRTGHAWRAAYHVEKTLAGHPPEALPLLETDAVDNREDRRTYLEWVERHRFDAVVSSLHQIFEWNAELECPPEVALFNVRSKGQQGIDLNLDQMAETAVELLLMEMQLSLVNRNGTPFRVHIPGRWVDAA